MKIVSSLIVIGAIQFIVGIYLFKKQRLTGRHLYSWLIISLGIAVSGFLLPTKFVTRISIFFGIHDNTVLFITIAIFALLIMHLTSTIKLSEHERRMTKITQELGLISTQIDRDTEI